MSESNRKVYNRPEVASHYAGLNYLAACEHLLFDLYIRPGAAALDLGVGGGRTAPYLSGRASRYVGVDYAAEMIRLCRSKYPDLEFIEAEASDLSAFASGSFDTIVIAFNGVDYVIPDAKRVRCFEECNRVLKPGGVLLFSSHNPRSIFVRANWNLERVRAGTRSFVGGLQSMSQPVFVVLGLAAWTRALLRAGSATLSRGTSRIVSRAFWRGEGYLRDAAHGGLVTHCWVPARVVAELQGLQFQMERIVGDDYPHASNEYITDWYYYVFSKPNSVANGENCES